MGKWFKSKEEKHNELLEKRTIECDKLNHEYDYLKKCVCKYQNYIFVFHGFFIDEDNEVRIKYCDFNTPEGYTTDLPYHIFEYKVDSDDLHKLRVNWVKFRDNLSRIGVHVTNKKKS